jgi:hypothetical protein
MIEELHERENKLREFFGLPAGGRLRSDDALPEITPAVAENLARFNFEWHVIPSAEVVPFDDNYIRRLYPMKSGDFSRHTHHAMPSLRESLAADHRLRQGNVIAVETTIKPQYLPGNHQFYGTPYGWDPTADPLALYMARAGFATGTRFDHDYASLRRLIELITKDWDSRSALPAGYRLTICSPTVFNLVGSVFHPEWSENQTLELTAYRDDHGNASPFAVGSSARGDFSYVHLVETGAEWTLLGFRLALVPDRHGA